MKLLKFFKWYYWLFFILVICLVYIQVTADLEIPSLLTEILNQAGLISKIRAQYPDIAIPQNLIDECKAIIWDSGLKMLMCAAISFVCNVAVCFLASRISAGYTHDLRREVYKKIQHFSLSEIDNFSTSSLITRSTNDLTQIQMIIVMILRIALSAPFMAIRGIQEATKQASTSNLNLLVIFGVVALCLLVLVLFMLVYPKFKVIQKNTDDLNLVTRENLTGIRVVRANNAQQYEEEKFEEVNGRLTKTNVFVNRVMSIMNPGMMIVMNITSLLILWIGAYAIDSQQLQLGDVFGFQQYTMMICMAFMQLIMIFVMVPRGAVSAGRVLEILKSDNLIKEPRVSDEENCIGTVEFKNVSFNYGNSDEAVVKNINFKIEQGQTLAIIGSTGSGKSTILNLLNRFYDPTEGEVLIDGVNVKNYKFKDLREKIGYIPQKSNLFSGTIKSNLLFGKENASNEELDDALKIAQAYDFVYKLDDKLDSWVAQGGVNFSGGQKQRLCIARAVIKKPEIYAFDDSFSALDLKTDKALREALKEDKHISTKIIVAQRIGTILNADKIIVLEKGEVVGIGNHHELMESCSVYQEIAYSQLSKEELNNA
ncbi:MAG: ABC transporter ATP-binding protein [Anaeroplasma sp.]